jgi:hypothetical protein
VLGLLSFDLAIRLTKKTDITGTVPPTQAKTNTSTHLDIAHPLSNTILLALDIHHPWWAATAQQDENIVESRRLL